MSEPSIANILSIAGSDPSGGAGIQADLKAFSALGTYGMAVLTALTAQNTNGVSAVVTLEPAFVKEQIHMVFADVRVDAVKVGMIANAHIARAVAEALAVHETVPVVLDPVMVAKGGARLLDPAASAALVEHLLPRATLVTPNLPEAAALLGEDEVTDRAAMQSQAVRLAAMTGGAVLLKGGHLPGVESPDLLLSSGAATWFEMPRIATANTHGTGCTLSSAIAAELGRGRALQEAVASAKTYLTGAIQASGQLSVGSGHGPVHHFHALWGAGSR